MKIDYNHLLTFVLLFMTTQYVFMSIEWKYYLDMLSDIQRYKFNFYKNEKNEFILKNIIIYIFIYFLLSIILYYYIIKSNKSLFEGFFFIILVYTAWDLALFSCFDKGVYYWPIQLFDIFITGGLSIIITKYILNNFYDTLKKYIPLLFIFYLITMFWFFYECYKYNPDLSNIKDIVLF